MRTGVATFTLDWGRCPRWLFERMVRLARVVGVAVVEEFGTQEFLRRLSDPVWFQSLGTVLAFDWNASGLTTTTMGALKVAFEGVEDDYGFYLCGGKGRSSRKTPQEIENWGNFLFTQRRVKQLTDISRLTAKVDTSLIQDEFAIYHHNFIFDRKGNWTVVQQGMNTAIGRARRYHWYQGESTRITQSLTDNPDSLIEEPHSGIASQAFLPSVLNLTSKKSAQNREIALELVCSRRTLYKDLKILAQKGSPDRLFKVLELPSTEFHSHPVEREISSKNLSIGKFFYTEALESPRIKKSIQKLIIRQPRRFDELLLTPGVGPKTVRALSLVAEVIYGAKPSYEDPARYSFAHGGKDGTPYPVDRNTYDETLAVLEKALLRAKLYYKEKDQALRRAELAFST